MTITEFCGQNQDYQRLLGLFTQEYIEAYNKRRVAQRKDVKIYLHRNFMYWYYSSLDMYRDVSPANFINSDINHKFKEKTAVFPVCKPVYKKEKLIDIEYTFKVFSLENHPFINDISTLVNSFRDDKVSVLGKYISLVDDESYDFAFKEYAYMEVLYDVCMGLNIICFEGEESDENLLIDEEAYNAFLTLTTKEQLSKIVFVVINQFRERLVKEPLCKTISVKQLQDILKKGMTSGDYMEKLYGESINIADMEDLYSKMSSYDEDDFTEKALQDMLPQMQDTLSSALVYAMTQRFFFLPIGHYLQLIQLFYSSAFSYELDDEYIEMLQQPNEDAKEIGITTFLIYTMLTDCYKLSPLGIELFRKGRKDSKQPFDDIDHDDYEEVLNDMLEYEAEDFDDDSDNPFDIDFGDIFKQMQNDYSSLNDKYLFNVKPWRSKESYTTCIVRGNDTMGDLAELIIAGFDLESLHLYAFYMGDKFYDSKNEIMASGSGEGNELGAGDYKINKMNFNKKQKFLFLYDFGDEHKFQIEFMGTE